MPESNDEARAERLFRAALNFARREGATVPGIVGRLAAEYPSRTTEEINLAATSALRAIRVASAYKLPAEDRGLVLGTTPFEPGLSNGVWRYRIRITGETGLGGLRAFRMLVVDRNGPLEPQEIAELVREFLERGQGRSGSDPIGTDATFVVESVSRG